PHHSSPLSLHDALPIYPSSQPDHGNAILLLILCARQVDATGRCWSQYTGRCEDDLVICESGGITVPKLDSGRQADSLSIADPSPDRKSTRLNSSHVAIS